MRKLNWDKPLSDEDVAWVRQSGMLYVDGVPIEEAITRNQESAGREVPEPEMSGEGPIIKSALDATVTTGEPVDDDGPVDDYDEWKVNELREEAQTRTPNVDLEDVSKARKQDLIDALRRWDENHA